MSREELLKNFDESELFIKNLSQNGHEQIAKIQNLSQNEIKQIIKCKIYHEMNLSKSQKMWY